MKNTLQLFALSCLIISSAVAMDSIVDVNSNKANELKTSSAIKDNVNTKSTKPVENKTVDTEIPSNPQTATLVTVTPANPPANTVDIQQPSQDKTIENTDNTTTTDSKVIHMMNTVAGAVSLQFAWNYVFSKTGTTDWVAKSVYNFAEDSRFAKLNAVSRAHVIYTLTAAGVLYGAYKIVRNYYENSVEEDIFAANN